MQDSFLTKEDDSLCNLNEEMMQINLEQKLHCLLRYFDSFCFIFANIAGSKLFH